MTPPEVSRSAHPRHMWRFIAAALIFLAVAAACLGYLLPQLQTLQAMTASTREATRALQLQMRELEALEARHAADRARYAALERGGFLGPQERLDAARALEALRLKHRITGLDYQIAPVAIVNVLRDLEPADVKLADTRIRLSMRGFLDRDLHDFVAGVIRALPGHVAIVEMEVTRLLPPEAQNLAQISRGGGADLVSGTAELSWQAVQPLDDANAPETQ